MEAVHARLSRVVIEGLPYADFIRRHDRAGTLFYLDPPYLGTERAYGPGLFARDDYARLAAILARLKGRFILSINDTPEIRKIFAGFRRTPVETTYTLSGGTTPAAELIITGGARGTHEPAQNRLQPPLKTWSTTD